MLHQYLPPTSSMHPPMQHHRSMQHHPPPMPHHHPPPLPMPQPMHPAYPQVHAAQPPLYSHPPHSHPPHPQPQPRPPAPAPLVVPASYLPSATSLYADLLQPLAIELLTPFPHAQHQVQTSTFGFTHVYPVHPLFSLSQSPPHLPFRPSQLTLAAPSQHALHEFLSHSESLLPGFRGHIEQTESGERCTTRDLDGNVIEIYWSGHILRRSSRYPAHETQPRIHNPPREPDSPPAFSPNRQRDLDRGQPFPSHRERNPERERLFRVRDERRVEHVQGNQRLIINDTTFETEHRPSRETERVLQWQQDVLNSTRDRDDTYHAEEYEEPAELEEYEISGYSDDDEPPPNKFIGYKQSNPNRHRPRERRNTMDPYQETYHRADNYLIHGTFSEDYEAPHECRREIRRQKNRSSSECHGNEYGSRAKSSRSNPAYGLLTAEETKSNSESSSPSPTDFNRLKIYAPESSHNQSTNYKERPRRKKRLEGEPSRRRSGRRRDSGIGGLGGLSSGEKDRVDSDDEPIQRYRSEGRNKSRTPKEKEMRHTPRKHSEPNKRNVNSRRHKGKELERINESRQRYESSQSESDDESESSCSSDSEYDYRPETSRRTREKKKGRSQVDDEFETRHRMKDLEKANKSIEATHRAQKKSKQHSRKGKSRCNDQQSSMSGIPVITQCPSSISGPSMGAEKYIAVQVPTPPSALPVNSQRRERKKIAVEEDLDGYSENPDDYGETQHDHGAREWPDQQATPHVSSRNRYHEKSHRSGEAANHNSSRRREQSRTPRYRYAPSIDPSESGSSIEDHRERVRERKGKGRRSTRY